MPPETVAQTLSKAWDETNTSSADTSTVDTTKAVTTTEDTYDAPSDWAHEDRESFRGWGQDVRKAFLGRLDTMRKADETKYADQSKFFTEYSPFRDVVAPRMQALQQRGVQPLQWFQNLAQLDDFATRSPKDFVKWYVNQTGLNPAEIFAIQQAQQQAGGDGQYVDPQVTAMQGEIAQLKQMLGQTHQGFQQFQTTLQQQQEARRNKEIEDFRTAKGSDGKSLHPYFDEVKDMAINLLRAGAASDLKSAYESAVYAHAPTRAKLLADQQAQQKRDAEKAQREHAQKAKQADVAVKPSAGSKPNGHDNGKRGESVMQTLRRAQAQIENRQH